MRHPVLSPDVEISAVPGSGGEFIAGIRGTPRYIVIRRVEREILVRLDGSRTSEELRARLRDEGIAISAESLRSFLDGLQRRGFLSGAAAAAHDDSATRRWSIRIPLGDPDALFANIARRVHWMFRRPVTLTFTGTLIVIALCVFQRAAVLRHDLERLLHGTGWIALAAIVLAVTATHEMAHGVTCKHYGGSVRELGLLLLLGFLPGLYCNVSDLYLFPQRRQRLAVVAAGAYWQLLVSGAFGALWLLSSQPSWLHDASVFGIAGGALNLLFNCNPLVRLDGYYALCIVLGEPNLASRSAAYVWQCITAHLETRMPSAATRPILYTTYWLASTSCTTLLTLSAAAFAGKALMTHRPLLGAFAMVIAGAGWLGTRARHAWQRLAPLRPRRRRALAALVVVALLIPWRGSVGAPCHVHHHEAGLVIRSARRARIAAVHALSNQRVSPGQRLVTLEDESLVKELETRRLAVERGEADLRGIEQRLLSRASALEITKARLRERVTFERDLTRDPVPAAVAVAEADHAAAVRRAGEAARQEARATALAADALIAGQQVDAARVEAAVRAAELERARGAIAVAARDHRATRTRTGLEIGILRAEARAQEIALSMTRMEWDARIREVALLRRLVQTTEAEQRRLSIAAPRAGVVLSIVERSEVGRLVAPGEEVCHVGARGPVFIEISVPEASIGEVDLAAPVRFKIKGFPSRVFDAVVVHVRPLPVRSGASRAFLVRAQVDSSDVRLTPEMTGFARVYGERRPLGWLLLRELWQLFRPEVWFL